MRRSLIALESQEQIKLFKWAAYHPIAKNYLWATPNGGSRHLLEAINLRKQGVKRGVSDIFFAYPSGKFHGLFIEMKRSDRSLSTLSEEQLIFLTNMKAVGFEAVVSYGADHAIEIITTYLKGDN